jgi:16S rRNA (uracil1498-N3)-methyltransferase
LFFALREQLLGPGPLILSGAEGRHAAVVRRLRPGERINVGDGAGLVASCVVTGAGGGSVELSVESRREVPRPSPAITVIQAIPKGDRGELAVEEMTEVGIDRIVPWTAERSVPVWHAGSVKGVARWRAKAREAAKQAERAWIPEVTDPVSTPEAAGLVACGLAAGGLAVGAGAGGVAGAGVAAGAGLAVLLDPDAADPLAGIGTLPDGDLILIVGPEGGIAPAESAALTAAGAKPYRLGPSVLRTSTAGAVAAAVLLSRTPRWA